MKNQQPPALSQELLLLSQAPKRSLPQPLEQYLPQSQLQSQLQLQSLLLHLSQLRQSLHQLLSQHQLQSQPSPHQPQVKRQRRLMQLSLHPKLHVQVQCHAQWASQLQSQALVHLV